MPKTADRPTFFNIKEPKLRLLAKDRIDADDYVAAFTDHKNNISVLCSRETGSDWTCEVFRGETKDGLGSEEQHPIGKFRTTRLNVTKINRLTGKVIDQYDEYIAAGRERVVYSIN